MPEPDILKLALRRDLSPAGNALAAIDARLLRTNFSWIGPAFFLFEFDWACAREILQSNPRAPIPVPQDIVIFGAGDDGAAWKTTPGVAASFQIAGEAKPRIVLVDGNHRRRAGTLTSVLMLTQAESFACVISGHEYLVR